MFLLFYNNNLNESKKTKINRERDPMPPPLKMASGSLEDITMAGVGGGGDRIR